MNEQLITSKIQQINSENLKQELLNLAAPKGHLKWQTILTTPWTILRAICHEFIARHAYVSLALKLLTIEVRPQKKTD